MSSTRIRSFAAAIALLGLVGAVLLLYFGPAQAQSRPVAADTPLWQEVDQSNLVQSASLTTLGGSMPTRYRLLRADPAALDAILAQAPLEGAVNAASAPAVLTLPMPDGSLQRFAIEEYAMLEPAFAAAHPEFKTYQGRGLDNPASTVQVSRTPWGFHSMVLSNGRLAYVDPQPDSAYYISYADTDVPAQQFSDGHIRVAQEISQQPAAVTVSGDRLHRYRLAMAATGEFTQEAGGQQAAQSKIIAFVNDMNGIYQRDLSVRFVLIDNTNIIYTNGATDPYSNGNAGTMLGQNQTNLDATVGNANYDIGYVLGTNMGGVARLGGLCVAGGKGSGSGSVGVTLHEMAHLLGGDHTFNARSTAADNCDEGNYGANAAYEPGSGSTILSYNGICGPQNLESSPNDTYFHAISIQEMTNYINGPGNTCGTHDLTGNAPPTVNAGVNRTIPARTSFTLVGQATDPNGDPLTYTWEQFDRGQAFTNASVMPNNDLGDNPIFRSYPPTGDNFRTFPSLTSSFAARGESLPTTNRTMKFRLTVRDGKGGVNAADVALQVVNTAGPFTLTSPQAGAIWAPGSQQAVTWNVANTNQAPVSCAAVDILASGDGGKTFAALVSNTPNDGSENVTAPNAQSAVMIKVACTNNVFHAISPKPGVSICNAVFVDNHDAGGANWTAASDATRGWALQTTGGHSGANFWFTSFFGFGTTTLDSQARTADKANLSLTFYHRYMFTPSQTGKAQINVNNGGWQDLKGFAGKSAQYDAGGYTAETVALNNLVKVNDSFQLRFQRVTACCEGVQGNANDGWFLDDVSVCSAVALPPAPTATPTTPPNATATPTALPEATNTPVPTATPVTVVGPDEATWTGDGTTDDWNEGANWAGGHLPTLQRNAVIPAGLAKYPTISKDAAVRDLNIAEGAVVNMTGGILTVTGNFGGANAQGRQETCQDLSGGEAGNANPKIFGAKTVSDTIIVPSGGRLTDLDVYLDVAHDWVGDVVASLQHGGNTATLVDPSDDNCDAENFAITLDDEAAGSVASACVTGNNPAFAQARYKPNQALTVFDNQAFAGPWVLTLSDVYPDLDDGSLRKWCVSVTTDTPVGRFNGTGGRVVFTGNFAHTLRASPDSTFNDLQVGDGSSAQQVDLASDLDINGMLELAAGGVLNDGDFTIELAGNWSQATNADFNSGNGSVVLDGGVQVATGNLRFNNLTINAGTVLDMSDYELAVSDQLVNNGEIRQTKVVNGTEWVSFIDAGGYGGVDINANGVDLGETTVSISRGALGCTSKPNETVQRCFEIAPANTTGRNADLRFYYTDDEQSLNSCSAMQAYQIDEGSSTLNKLSRIATRCNINPRGLWVDEVSDFTISQIVLGAAVGEPGSRADEPPVAISDTLLTEVDTAITFEVLENDFDPEGKGLTLDSIGQPSHGTAKVIRSGQISYTPAQGFTGKDTFSYEISDINDNKSTGEITVVIAKVTVPAYLPLIVVNQRQQEVDAAGWQMKK